EGWADSSTMASCAMASPCAPPPASVARGLGILGRVRTPEPDGSARAMAPLPPSPRSPDDSARLRFEAFAPGYSAPESRTADSLFETSDSEAPPPPGLADRFDVFDRIGAGGLGQCFKAFDRQLRR